MPSSADQQLIHRFSQQLYQNDPMNTCCNANEGMEDEYLSQAQDIAHHLSEGVPLREALMRTFDHWFWEGCLLEEQRQSSLTALLASLNAVVQEKDA